MPERRTISSGSTFEDQIGCARAVIDGDRVHVAGPTGFDDTAMTISDDVVEQTEQRMRNIGGVLAEAGCTFNDGPASATSCPTATTSRPAGRSCAATSAKPAQRAPSSSATSSTPA